MKSTINILPITSNLHQQDIVEKTTDNLLNDLSNKLNKEFKIVSVDDLYLDSELSLILVQTGGSEGVFLNLLPKLKEPFYILTYGTNNSLAASLEILSYIKDNNLKGEVLHGNNDYLAAKIINLLAVKYRYGIIGKPSDWLIASKVNYDDAFKYKIKLIDIDIKEVEKEFDLVKDTNIKLKYELDFDKEEVTNSDILPDALEILEGSRVYIQLSTSEYNGESNSWKNLLSWKRANVLELL